MSDPRRVRFRELLAQPVGMSAVVDLSAIRKAQPRVALFARETPLIASRHLTELLGPSVYLKAEALQRTGSFKVRGAANRLGLLSDEERRRGVIAASAGNHGQGVALVASSMGIDCTVVMPTGASVAKAEAVKAYGGRAVFDEDPFARALALAEQDGLTLIHPFDDEGVIAGQGTLGLEILEQLPEPAQVVVPVGGGGLAAGVAIAVKSLRPGARVLGVQAAAAPGVRDSLRAGEVLKVRPSRTIADGVAVAGPGEMTLPLLARYVDDVVLVEEEAIAQAIVLLLERSKLVVEGAGALAAAAVLAGLVPPIGPTVLIASGGNIDIHLLARAAEHGLVHAGRYLSIAVELEDRPTELAQLLALIAGTEANVLQVEHHRWGVDLPMGRVQAALLLETRGPEHARAICLALAEAGYAELPTGDVAAPRRFLLRAGIAKQALPDELHGPPKLTRVVVV